MQKFINEFPMLKQYTYANTAATGLLSERLLEWRQEHDLDYLIGGSTMKAKSLQLITATKKAVSSFFKCSQENVSLIPNFSLGLNMLLEGLDRSHQVLLLEEDYPSVNWPFERRGFSTRYVKIDANLEANILKQLQEHKISVLALSLIQWANGIKIDLKFLKQIKEAYPHLLIIADGTQFCGTCDFDFEDSAIDVLGASAYKWMLAGYGNGFLLFKDRVKEIISINTIGFYAANANLENRDHVRFSKQFEPGHLDTLNFGSLHFSIENFMQIGMKNIEEKIKLLSSKAKQVFSDLNLLEDSVLLRGEHSSIFNIKGDDALFQKLSDHDIICAQRGSGIRLSFHFYNSEADINRIEEVLKKAL